MKTMTGSERTEPLRGLAPLDVRGARFLVLGSFPSVLSLEKSEYYGHPRNHFWPLMATIAASRDKGEPRRDGGAKESGGFEDGRPSLAKAPPDWPSRVSLAARLGVAIWDLVASCERGGSLDVAIRGAVLNEVDGFVASRPTIGVILLNGGAAATYFARRFAPKSGLDSSAFGEMRGISLGGRELLACRLPSTSPVPTRRFRTAADKLLLWEKSLLYSS